MNQRPSEKSILETYSIDDLLSLVKEKAQLNIEAEFEGLKQYMDSFMTSSSGTAPVTKVAAERPVVKEPSAPAGPKKGKRVSKRVPLGNLLMEVLGDEPMGVEEILAKLIQQGYKSKSKDPRRILYIELGKQVEKGTVQKAGRGLYQKG